MAPPRLTKDQERTLLWFVGPSGVKEDGEELSRAVFQFSDFRLGPEVEARELLGLRRRKLIASEGRGIERQWFITAAGIDALSANGHDVGGEN